MHFKAQIQIDYSKPNASKIHVKYLNSPREVFLDYEWGKAQKDKSGVVLQMTRRYDGVKHLFTDDKWHYFEATNVK